jgi:hypothetical protein
MNPPLEISASEPSVEPINQDVSSAASRAMRRAIERKYARKYADDPILSELLRNLRETARYVAMLNRFLAKPSPTKANRKTIRRAISKQHEREERMKALVAAHPSTAWAQQYVAETQLAILPTATQLNQGERIS